MKTSKNLRPTPPNHLEPVTARWWKSVVESYSLEEHHIRLLTHAAETWDLVERARKIIAKEGFSFTDSHGNLKARPEVAVARDGRIAFARLIRELDLDAEPPAQTRRPPAILSNRRA